MLLKLNLIGEKSKDKTINHDLRWIGPLSTYVLTFVFMYSSFMVIQRRERRHWWWIRRRRFPFRWKVQDASDGVGITAGLLFFFWSCFLCTFLLQQATDWTQGRNVFSVENVFSYKTISYLPWIQSWLLFGVLFDFLRYERSDHSGSANTFSAGLDWTSLPILGQQLTNAAMSDS